MRKEGRKMKIVENLATPPRAKVKGKRVFPLRIALLAPEKKVQAGGKDSSNGEL